MDEYLKWYLIVSHPRIISPRQHGDDARYSHTGTSHAGSSHPGPSHYEVPSDIRVPSNDIFPPTPPSHGDDDAQSLQMILLWITSWIW